MQQTPFTSLEAALAAFLEPETLEGDNAYYCEEMHGRFDSENPSELFCCCEARFRFRFIDIGLLPSPFGAAARAVVTPAAAAPPVPRGDFNCWPWLN